MCVSLLGVSRSLGSGDLAERRTRMMERSVGCGHDWEGLSVAQSLGKVIEYIEVVVDDQW